MREKGLVERKNPGEKYYATTRSRKRTKDWKWSTIIFKYVTIGM
jgi:hypothetical protein